MHGQPCKISFSGIALKNISICIHFHTTTVENGLLRSMIIFSLKRFPLRRCIVLTTASDENFYCYIKKRTKKNDMCVYYFWNNELVTMRGMLECLKLHMRNVFVWKSLGWATDLLHICYENKWIILKAKVLVCVCYSCKVTTPWFGHILVSNLRVQELILIVGISQ